ncbi:DUF948 domain-containing protein [Bacillus sp. FSL K6-1005]|uniref:DUF948 domain-containing protein n=1 Tax=Bacillus sp. FSL K6-1005 TaxID=2954676 RepID=UPI0030FCAEA9
MVIVYISIAVIAISIIYLGINVIQNKKKIDPAMKELTAVTQSMQKQVEVVKTEAQQLSQKQKMIQYDVEMKKTALQQTVAEVKEAPQAVKEVWHANRG